MDKVHIWYITDNEPGRDIAGDIADIGLDVAIVAAKSLKKKDISPENINIFIFDLTDTDIQNTLSLIRDDQRLHPFPKYIILNKRKIKEALNTSISFLHTEFLSRPVHKREFILLLEKTVIVERYREVMKYISLEAVSRIETYENIININRRDIFVTDEEKESFKNIFFYEKNLMKKQLELNKSISEYTLLRQKEMFYDENKVKAEEMLEELRSRESFNNIPDINRQERLSYESYPASSSGSNPGPDYLSGTSDSHKKIERLSMENNDLARKLVKLKEEKEKQSIEISRLKQQIKALKTVNETIH